MKSSISGLIAVICLAATPTVRAIDGETDSVSLSAGAKGLHCVEADGAFKFDVLIDESGRASGQLAHETEGETALVVRTISTNLYPRSQVELVQLYLTQDLKHPLTLNLVKSYDCVEKQTGETHPLRALIMAKESKQSPLLPYFKGHNICCSKTRR